MWPKHEPRSWFVRFRVNIWDFSRGLKYLLAAVRFMGLNSLHPYAHTHSHARVQHYFVANVIPVILYGSALARTSAISLGRSESSRFFDSA